MDDEVVHKGFVNISLLSCRIIDSAIAYDEIGCPKHRSKAHMKETLLEREFRTRAPNSERQDPAYYFKFCPGDPVQLIELVDKVIKAVLFHNHNHTRPADEFI